MKLTKHALSALAIAISTILYTPVSLAVNLPENHNTRVVVNNNEELKLIASEGYNPKWGQFGFLIVGEISNGYALLDNMPIITRYSTIGNNAEGSITLLNHTNWQLNVMMELGVRDGSGTVYVLEGSKISGLQELRIGDAKGMMFIDGENSSVTSKNTTVGNLGTGSLHITNGGTLTSLAQLNIGYAYPANGISENFTSYGDVLVDGENSILNAQSISLGGFSPDVPVTTTGILTVSNNATINSNSSILVTVAPGATGIINIGGAQGEAEQPAGSINTPFIHLGAVDPSSTSIVNFNHSSTDFLLASDIQGNGQINQVGSGTTTLSGSNSYAGDTNITKGSLRAGKENTFSPNSDYIVDSEGHLDLNTYSQTLNTLALAGTTTLSSYEQGHEFTPTTLTINGNYTADDGLLVMHTVLGDDNSVTDKLIIKGDTSGSTRIM
ncbi:autotransporter outer membrane beta-barrel domain-containing protein, partial [Escherichia sp. E2748]|uniref:autotransporter outer membrane beta-barrel domain-containing protein n=2 Tax=Escherichia sp. E2748 TaxID=2044460 RepID=UPI001F110DBF